MPDIVILPVPVFVVPPVKSTPPDEPVMAKAPPLVVIAFATVTVLPAVNVTACAQVFIVLVTFTVPPAPPERNVTGSRLSLIHI